MVTTYAPVDRYAAVEPRRGRYVPPHVELLERMDHHAAALARCHRIDFSEALALVWIAYSLGNVHAADRALQKVVRTRRPYDWAKRWLQKGWFYATTAD